MPRTKTGKTSRAADSTGDDKRRSAAPRKLAGKRALPPKLTPPRPANIYPRERLFALLDKTRRDHSIVWVSAPAGAGKTSLATSYLSARKLPSLWYQVDAGDGDVATFFYYMGIAAAHAAPRHRRPLPVLTAEYLADLPTFARNYFRQLYARLPPSCVVVLDNYQDAPGVSLLHDVTQIAMSEVPAHINLFVLSRVEPPSVLARLRICEHAACIDWSKMQLTQEETAGISAARAGKHPLDNQALDVLHARAYGWAAGLVLLLEQSRSGAVPDVPQTEAGQKLLFDYFASEFFAHTNSVEQSFLLKTSLFTKFSVSDTRAITGLDGAGAVLKELTARNYFTVRHVGSLEDTYEYHPLFRDFLRAQAERHYPTKELNALRRQAAEILEAASEIEAAVVLRQKAQDWDGVGRAITGAAPVLLAQGRAQMLLQWIESIPPTIKNQLPWLLFWEGMSRLAFDPIRAREPLEQAYTRFKRERDAVGAYTTWSGIIESFVYEWSSFKPVLRWIEEFEQLAQELPVPQVVQVEARVACTMFLALMYAKPQHPHLVVYAAHVARILEEAKDVHLCSTIAPHFLIYHTWWLGDLVRAEMLLMTLRPIVTAPGVSPLARITWQVNVAALYWMTAANDECIAAADEGLRLADTYGIHLWDMFLCTQAVFGRLFKAGNVTAAEPYYARMTQQVNPARIMDAAFLHYLLGPKFFFLNDLDQAQAQLERALALGNETAYVWGLPHIMIDLGRVLFYQGKHAQALATVRAARDEKVVGYLSSTHEYLAYLTEAELALLTNDESACAEALRHSLAVGARQRFQNHTWWRNDLMARLYAKALAHGIEVSYVRHMIEKRGLLPPKDDPVPDTWPFLIKIYTLGSFVLHKDDEPVRFAIKAQRKPLELLKALIVFGGEEVSELTLCDALWPDADADLARQNLKATLHRVRKLVGPETIVLMDGKVSINDRRCWVDAWAFERQIDRTLDLRKDAADPGQLAAATDAAVKLYRGPFLATEDLSFVHIARERLRGKFLRAIGRLADVLQANGEPERSISYLEKGLELDPLAEQFYQGLMRAYMKLGRCADVLKTHERCRMNLHASLRVAPSPETEALRQQARVTAN